MINTSSAPPLSVESRLGIYSPGFNAIEKIKTLAQLLFYKIQLGIHSLTHELFHQSICKKNISPSFLEHRRRSLDHITQSLHKKTLHAQEAMLEESNHPSFHAISGLSSPNIALEKHAVGPYDFGVAHCQGLRPTMEDNHLACEATVRIEGSTNTAQFFGVMDGHGGKNAADWVKAQFVRKFQLSVQKLESLHPSWSEEQIIWNALKTTYVFLSEAYKGQDGTTASIVVILKNRLWCANAGDTRAFINSGNSLIPLTEDMKPAQENMPHDRSITQESPGRSTYHTHYTQRILNRQGTVSWNGVPRINGDLACGGSIGDHHVEGISARPAITSIDLNSLSPNSYLCIGCDGVFDVASTRQINEVLKKTSDRGCSAAAKAIVASAFYSGSSDNISALIVNLSQNQSRPSEEIAKKSRCWNLLPFAAIGLGAITGLAGRFLSSPVSAAVTEKSKEACRSAFSKLPLLQTINGFKQWEIKNLAYAAPLIPVAAGIVSDVYRDQSKKGLFERIKTAVKNNFSLEQTVYLAALIALSLPGVSYCRSLGFCSTGFDPSGHMMIKIAVAAALSSTVSSPANRKKSTFNKIFCGICAVTDAVLIHNTVRSCHTIAETAAGLAWGLGIAASAKYLSKRFSSTASPPPSSLPASCSSTG